MEDILDRLQQGVCGLSAAWRAGHMHEFEQFLRVLSETWGHRLAHDGYAFADLADTIAELDEMLLDEQARAAALAEKFESFIQLCRRAVLRD
jgi:hypothetical protein